MRKLRFERPDAAIIDLMLPGMDGWQITKDARAEGMQIPVLIVSARASEPDKVHALGLGADDYLAKPFGMPELVARVQALLRRLTAPAVAATGKIHALQAAFRRPRTRCNSTNPRIKRITAKTLCWRSSRLWVIAYQGDCGPKGQISVSLKTSRKSPASKKQRDHA